MFCEGMEFTNTAVVVTCAPENSMLNSPAFFISATMGEVVAAAVMLLMEPKFVITAFSISLIYGDLSRNQLMVPVLE
jgi:hypothetical protein